MDAEGKARLAIRTVVVTTRAAVEAHRRAGRDDLVRETAHRGVTLLRGLDQAVRDNTAAAYEDAEQQLEEMATASDPVAISVEAPAESLPPRTGRRSPEAPS